MKDSETQGEEQSLSPDDERLIKTGLKVFKNIATKWSMTLEQQSALLGCDDETLNRWMHGNVTPTEQELMKLVLTRISHVFGIYRSLHLLIENEELADSWCNRPPITSCQGQTLFIY